MLAREVESLGIDRFGADHRAGDFRKRVREVDERLGWRAFDGRNVGRMQMIRLRAGMGAPITGNGRHGFSETILQHPWHRVDGPSGGPWRNLCRGREVVKVDYRNGVRISAESCIAAAFQPLLGEHTRCLAASSFRDRSQRLRSSAVPRCETPATSPTAHLDAFQRRSEFHDLAGARAGRDPGLLAEETAADHFAAERQDGIVARGGAPVFVHPGETRVCGIG